MKHIKTLTILLLANSFSINEVTWKEIETEIKPHIEDVEFDFSEIKKNISEVYKQYKETTGTATEFDDFGDYLTEEEKSKENKIRKTKEEKKTKGNAKIEKNEKIAKTKKSKAEKIKEIKEIIQTIIKSQEKDNIEIDNIKITSNKDILQGIDKILKSIKNTAAIVANFNNLKTFSDIKEFTTNYDQLINLLKKYQKKNKKDKLELEVFKKKIFFYTLIFSAIKEKKAEILELFDFPKSIITEIKEEKTIELKDSAATKIAHAFYNYLSDLLKILYTNRTKLDNFILKNKIASEYLFKQKDNKEKQTKKVFKNKSLNNMTIFEALSSEKNKETVRAESPSILALLEKFKGTEEENKKMTVRHAINILIDFTELSFAQPIEEQKSKTEIREQKEKIREDNFDQKQNQRIKKLEIEIEKLESQKRNTNEKDTKILDKEINALKNTIEKIKAETYKEQTYIDEKTDKNRTKLAEEKIETQGKQKRESPNSKSKPKSKSATKANTGTSLKEVKQKGKAAVKAATQEAFYNFDNRERSNNTSILSEEELEKAKKGRSKEV